jgi:LAO/AO transport system kinase
MTSYPDVLSLYEGIRNGSRRCLAQAITLIESTTNRSAAHELLVLIAPYTGKSLKVGFTGLPGSGKSTLVNEIGLSLCNAGARVAVLAIDPTSEISGGSILGDKTRMSELGSHPHSFIRPSPSKRDLGGVHRRTYETMMLCEAGGYTHILVETVGIGQSEGDIRQLVDVLVLTLITGAGDDLQGVKRGILELVDIVVFNKADGENEQRAIREAQRFQRYLRYFSPYTSGWKPTSLAISAFKTETLANLWDTVQKCSAVRATLSGAEKCEQHRRRFIRTLHRELLDLITAIPEVGRLIDSTLGRLDQGASLAEIEAFTTAREILSLVKVHHDTKY